MPGGLEDPRRVAVQVDEDRVGEGREQERDPRRVQRRLEDQPLAARLERQLGRQQPERRDPQPPFLVSGLGEGEVAALELEPAARKVPGEVRRETGHRRQRQLVLGRLRQIQPDVVVRPLADGEERAQPGAFLLRGQEGVRKARLEVVDEAEARIACDQVVEVGGARAVVAEDEERRRRLDLVDPYPVEPALAPGRQRRRQRAGGGQQGARPVARGDREAVSPQQPDPVRQQQPLERREQPSAEEEVESFAGHGAAWPARRSGPASTGLHLGYKGRSGRCERRCG